MLEVSTLRALQDNFIYVLRDSTTHSVAVVDPGDAEVVEAFLSAKGWPLQKIFCTHHHQDHTGGVLQLQQKFSCSVYTSEHDFSRIPGASVPLKDGDPFTVGTSGGLSVSIPGHTLGHWALHFTKENCIFVGDTLFSAGCGRLFEGTPQQMFSSLEKLKGLLNLETRIYFGHEYTERNLQFVAELYPNLDIANYKSTVAAQRAKNGDSTPTTFAIEMQVNPFLRAKTADEFARIRWLRNSF